MTEKSIEEKVLEKLKDKSITLDFEPAIKRVIQETIKETTERLGKEEVHCKNCGWPKNHKPHGWSPKGVRQETAKEVLTELDKPVTKDEQKVVMDNPNKIYKRSVAEVILLDRLAKLKKKYGVV